nr:MULTISPECIES: AlpA family phage regulatory protein [Shewanella]
MKIKEVTQMTSLSRSTIYTKINQQDFPQSISLSCRSVAWVRKEVEDWIYLKMDER